MYLGGIQKTSLIDYPKKISTVIFTQGCNFRCPYCHNLGLIKQDICETYLSIDDCFSILKKRKGLIDAVVITGGEPTIQTDLVSFIKEIKYIGFTVKIDTNGSNPLIVEKLLSQRLIDYIAMDYKAPISKYSDIVCVKVNTNNIKDTISLIVKSAIPYEIRTTVFGGLTMDDIFIMMEELSAYRVQNYYLQMAIFRQNSGSKKAFSGDINLLLESLKDNFKQYGFRNINKDFRLTSLFNLDKIS